MGIKEIARKLWIETAEIVPQCDHHLHFAEALVAEIQRQSEPIGWVHVDDVEYDGTTHSLRTINVMPSNFEKWVPIYVHPYDIESERQRVAEAIYAMTDDVCAKLQTDDKSIDYWHGVGAAATAIENAIRSGEWRKFMKGE